MFITVMSPVCPYHSEQSMDRVTGGFGGYSWWICGVRRGMSEYDKRAPADTGFRTCGTTLAELEVPA